MCNACNYGNNILGHVDEWFLAVKSMKVKVVGVGNLNSLVFLTIFRITGANSQTF